jgi:integrase
MPEQARKMADDQIGELAKGNSPAKAKREEKQKITVGQAMQIFEVRNPQKTGFVFPAHLASGHITPPKKRWQALIDRCGIADLHIHDLRRSLGSWQAITGASLVIIGKSLGHKSADATMIYTMTL